jgi:maleate cis-trans isomerase
VTWPIVCRAEDRRDALWTRPASARIASSPDGGRPGLEEDVVHDGIMRLGFLYPDHSAEDDYPRIAALVVPPVEAVVVHTSIGEDAHRVDALLDTGAAWRLRDGAGELRRAGVASAMWACTSGSFVFGLAGAREQARAVEEFLGVPVSSTSLAFASACRALGLRRVSIAATYPDDVAALFQQFLADSGVATVQREALGIITGVEVGEVDRDRVLAHAVRGDHPDAEAILMPDTALHTVAWLEDLEAAVGKIVLTANQVTMWEALRLAGALVPQAGLGTLFRTGIPAAS